jgi:hypothetical protein
MRRVRRVSPRAFDIFRLRQLGFRSNDSAPPIGKVVAKMASGVTATNSVTFFRSALREDTNSL